MLKYGQCSDWRTLQLQAKFDQVVKQDNISWDLQLPDKNSSQHKPDEETVLFLCQN